MLLKFTPYLRTYIKEIASCTENTYISLIFEENLLYIIGSRTDYSEILKLPVESDIYGAYRINSDNIKTMCLYDAVDIQVQEKDIWVSCFKNDKKTGALRILKENLIDYHASNLVQSIARLDSKIYDFGTIKQFYKLANLCSSGFCFQDGYIYGQGDGFTVYGVTDDALDFMLTPAVIKRITSLFDNKILGTDLGNRFVCEKNNMFFLIFNKYTISNAFDIKYLQKFKKVSEFELNKAEVMSLLDGVSTKNSNLIFNMSNNLLQVKSDNLDIVSLIDYTEATSTENSVPFKTDLSLMKSLIKMSEGSKLKFSVYNRFLLLYVETIAYMISLTVLDDD